MFWRSCISLFLVFALLACGCSDDGVVDPSTFWEGDTVTVSFRDGATPYPSYNGTRDAVLKDGPDAIFRNGNFGHISLDTLGSVYLGQSYYERRLMLRFDLSPVTGCIAVHEARISVRVEPNCADPITLEAYEVTLPPGYTDSWPEGSGGTGSGVSWLTIDGGAPWQTVGGDYEPMLLSETTVSCDSVATFTVPGSLVFKWILSPQENHGVIIKSKTVATESFRLLHLREALNVELRPVLWVKYLKRG